MFKKNIMVRKIKSCYHIWILIVVNCAVDESHYVLGDIGGHAIFASLSQLDMLWHNEIKIAKSIEKLVANSSRRHLPLER